MTNSWKKKLKQTLLQLKPNSSNETLKVVILGVGNELNGDDAIGALIARRLILYFSSRPTLISTAPLVFDCATAPENFSGPIREAAPDFVLIIDAGSFDMSPGEILFANWQDADGMGFSTHSLPPSVFASYLIDQVGCSVGLLLIQAKNTDFLAPLNAEIAIAGDEIFQELITLFNENH